MGNSRFRVTGTIIAPQFQGWPSDLVAYPVCIFLYAVRPVFGSSSFTGSLSEIKCI